MILKMNDGWSVRDGDASELIFLYSSKGWTQALVDELESLNTREVDRIREESYWEGHDRGYDEGFSTADSGVL